MVLIMEDGKMDENYGMERRGSTDLTLAERS
jgi:hypothetical protein